MATVKQTVRHDNSCFIVLFEHVIREVHVTAYRVSTIINNASVLSFTQSHGDQHGEYCSQA